MKDRIKLIKEHLDEIEKEHSKEKPNKEKMFDFFEVLWQEVGDIEMDIIDENRFCYLCGYGREDGRPWPAPPRRGWSRGLQRRLGVEAQSGD